jgi:hypothetical protein
MSDMLSSLDASVKAIAVCHTRVHKMYTAAHDFCEKANITDFGTWRRQLFSERSIPNTQKVPGLAKFYLDQADNMLFLSGALVKMLENTMAVSQFAYFNAQQNLPLHRPNVEPNMVAQMHINHIKTEWNEMCNKWCSLPTKFYFSASFAFHHWLKDSKLNAFQTYQPDHAETLHTVDYSRGEFLAIMKRKRTSKQTIRWGEFTNSMVSIYLNTRCIETRRHIQLEWADMLLVVPPSSVTLTYQRNALKKGSSNASTLSLASQDYVYFVTHFVMVLMQFGCAEQGVWEFFTGLPDTTEACKRQYLQLAKDILQSTSRWLDEWLETTELEEPNREVCLEVASTHLLLVAKVDGRMAPLDAPKWGKKQIRRLQTYQHGLLGMLKNDGTCIPHKQRRDGLALSPLYMMLDYHLHYLACVFFINIHNAQVEHSITNSLDVLQSVTTFHSLPSIQAATLNTHPASAAAPHSEPTTQKRRLVHTTSDVTDNDAAQRGAEEQATKRLKVDAAETLKNEGVLHLKGAINSKSVEALRLAVCASHAQTPELKRTSWMLNPFFPDTGNNLHLRLVGATASVESKLKTLSSELSRNPLLTDLLQHNNTNALASFMRALTHTSVRIMEDELYLRQKLKNANTSVHADIYYYKNHSGLFDAYRASSENATNESQQNQDTCHICYKSAHEAPHTDSGIIHEDVSTHIESTVLICDRCECTFHNDCLKNPLVVLPHGEWHCEVCSDKFVDAYTVWIPLHDINTSSESCLAVVPGSHLWPGFDTSLANRFWIPFDPTNRTNLQTLQSKWSLPANNMKQGDVIVFNTKLIHAATKHGVSNSSNVAQTALAGAALPMRHSMDARFVGVL